jgi:hypothetical protein
MFFNGLPEMKIENINVEDVTITSIIGAELVESKGIHFKNVRINPKEGAALILKNVEDVYISGFEYPSTLKEVVNISGSNKDIHLPKTIDKTLINETK